ncbi:ATP-binding cassette domain-containing protein [Alloscardovia venturai]|uniref:ATP-binding cassette domain-containing protein n=1 Tax=Alloscardovia venturai TaxID=1769421 RepID=A0ABW2Y3P5_9BIFI
MIEFRNVVKDFGDHRVLNSANFTIRDGEFFVLVGPSGSGKTTMLKMINALETATQGDVLVNGKRVTDYNLRDLRFDVGYVLQAGSLFPNLTVAENIAVIAKMKKWRPERIKQQTEILLDKVGLSPQEFMNRMPQDLSGGQAQRIGILRALITRPDIILMDEPFSALDPMSRVQLQELVVDLHKEFKTTVVFVTHDMTEAVKIADRVCIVHDGNIEQIGTPHDVTHHAATDFVAKLFDGQGI